MSDKEYPSLGSGPAQKAPSQAGELVDLVLERLKSLEGLSGLESAHEDMGWWRKRAPDGSRESGRGGRQVQGSPFRF